LPPLGQCNEICNDGEDNDDDNLVDCDDPDCAVECTPICSTADFEASIPTLGSSYSYGVSLGDLDDDGDLDAWVANEFGQANRVWINDGGIQGGIAGDFTGDQALGVVSIRSRGVALGDLDGDGDLDAWVANYGQTNRVWINDGAGDFSEISQMLGNFNSNGVALGDLDGDGDLDAWVANGDGQGNRVWINDGAGTFDNTNNQALGASNSNGVALGDLDGDGDLDAWVANTSSQANRVWINDGNGNFTNNQALGNSNSNGVALGDLDGDDDLDAWVANGDGQGNRVWINDGAGTFDNTNNQALGDSFSCRVALGDLDADGDLDAWVANYVNAPNHVWLNQGGAQGGVPGNFTDNQALGDSYSVDVALGDLDLDGDLDAWVANGLDQANRVWLNTSCD
jgi:hypothetical protein